MKDRNREGRSEPKRNDEMSREGFRGSTKDRKDRHTGEELQNERNRSPRGRNQNRDIELE